MSTYQGSVIKKKKLCFISKISSNLILKSWFANRKILDLNLCNNCLLHVHRYRHGVPLNKLQWFTFDSVFEQKMAWWVTWYESLGWCIRSSHWRDLKTFKSKNLRAHLTKLHISTQSLRKSDLEMGESLFSHLNYCHQASQWNIHRNISWYLHRNSKNTNYMPSMMCGAI